MQQVLDVQGDLKREVKKVKKSIFIFVFIIFLSFTLFCIQKQISITRHVKLDPQELAKLCPSAIIHFYEDVPRNFVLEVYDNYDNYKNTVKPEKVDIKIITEKYDYDGTFIMSDEVKKDEIRPYLMFTRPNFEILNIISSGGMVHCKYYKYYYVIKASDMNSEIIPPGLKGVPPEEDNTTEVWFPILIHDITPPKIKITFDELSGRRLHHEIVLDYKYEKNEFSSLPDSITYVVPEGPKKFLSSKVNPVPSPDMDGAFPKNKRYVIGITGEAFIPFESLSLLKGKEYFTFECGMIPCGATSKTPTIICASEQPALSQLTPTVITPKFYFQPPPGIIRKRITFIEKCRIKVKVEAQDNSGTLKSLSCKLYKVKQGATRIITEKNNISWPFKYEDLFIFNEPTNDTTTGLLKYEFLIDAVDLAGNELIVVVPIKVLNQQVNRSTLR